MSECAVCNEKYASMFGERHCLNCIKEERGMLTVRKQTQRLQSLLKVAEEMDKELGGESCYCIPGGSYTCGCCRAREAFAQWKRENP